jgi:hypothetical protein
MEETAITDLQAQLCFSRERVEFGGAMPSVVRPIAISQAALVQRVERIEAFIWGSGKQFTAGSSEILHGSLLSWVRGTF